MTALEVLIDEAAAALPLDPIEFRRRNALQAGRPHHGGKSLQRLGAHARDPGQAREASDLAAARARRRRAASRRECWSAPASPAPPRITAPAADCSLGTRGTWRRRAGSRSIATMSRWATASGPHWPIGWRLISAASPTRSRWREVDSFDALALVTSGDPYTMDQKTQDAAAEKSALGAGDQFGHQRLDRRACRHPCGGRGRARRSSASACGRRRSNCGASRRPIRGPRQWAKARWKDGATDDAGLAAAGVAGARRHGACAQLS